MKWSTPIVTIIDLSECDGLNIANLTVACDKYSCCYPDD